MKTIILSIGIFTTLLSCKKEEKEVLYKYAYVHEASVQDSAKIKVITTHIRPYKEVLTTTQINNELSQLRRNKPSYILIDTLVLLNNNNISNELYNKLKNK